MPHCMSTSQGRSVQRLRFSALKTTAARQREGKRRTRCRFQMETQRRCAVGPDKGLGVAYPPRFVEFSGVHQDLLHDEHGSPQ